MKVKNSKKANVPLVNDQGFTLIEMILSLFIFLVIVSMLPIGVRTVLDEGVFESGIRRMEWEVFSSQVKKDIRTADQITILVDKLLLKKNGKIILYEKYGSNMRRRVDYQGHEIMIQNLSGFQFGEIKEGVEIMATDLNGDLYTVRVHNHFQAGGVAP
jgi:competence protein ComGF